MLLSTKLPLGHIATCAYAVCMCSGIIPRFRASCAKRIAQPCRDAVAGDTLPFSAAVRLGQLPVKAWLVHPDLIPALPSCLCMAAARIIGVCLPYDSVDCTGSLLMQSSFQQRLHLQECGHSLVLLQTNTPSWGQC